MQLTDFLPAETDAPFSCWAKRLDIDWGRHQSFCSKLRLRYSPVNRVFIYGTAVNTVSFTHTQSLQMPLGFFGTDQGFEIFKEGT